MSQPPRTPELESLFELKNLFDSVNAAAKREAAQSFFFLALLLTLVAVIASTSHRTLFLEENIQVPFISVSLPVVGFYWVGPAILLAMHFYVLASMGPLAEKAEALFDRLASETAGDDKALRLLLHRLDSFPLLQVLAARRFGGSAWTMEVLVWSTLLLAPVAVFLWFQLRFLPYHSEAVTMWHRLALLADFCLLLKLWPRIEMEHGRWDLAWFSARVTAAGLVLLFSFDVASLPQEEGPGWERATIGFVSLASLEDGDAAPGLVARDRRKLSAWLLDGDEPLLTPRSLRLRYERFVTEKDEELARRPVSLVLTDRNFSFADLRDTDLRKAKFDGSRMQGATLNRVEMQGATLNGAQMQGATLNRAQMQGATLNGAQMQGATLNEAQLQGARLNGAQMQGATLNGAAVWRSLGAPKIELADLRRLLRDDTGGLDWNARVAEWVKDIPGEARAAATRRLAVLTATPLGITAAEPTTPPSPLVLLRQPVFTAWPDNPAAPDATARDGFLARLACQDALTRAIAQGFARRFGEVALNRREMDRALRNLFSNEPDSRANLASDRAEDAEFAATAAALLAAPCAAEVFTAEDRASLSRTAAQRP